MAQATGAMSASGMYVGVSTDNSTWVDASGYATSVEISGGDRQTGTVFTFDGDYPILKAGKRDAMTVTIRYVFTESSAQAYAKAKTAYEAGTAFYVRWSPGGGDAGEIGYTTGSGYIKNPPYAVGDAASGEPILCETQVECAYVTAAAIGTAGW